MKWYSLCAAALLLFCEGWGGRRGVHALHAAWSRGWCSGGPGPLGSAGRHWTPIRGRAALHALLHGHPLERGSCLLVSTPPRNDGLVWNGHMRIHRLTHAHVLTLMPCCVLVCSNSMKVHPMHGNRHLKTAVFRCYFIRWFVRNIQPPTGRGSSSAVAF